MGQRNRTRSTKLPRKRKKSFIKFHNKVPWIKADDSTLGMGSTHYFSMRMVNEVFDRTKFIKDISTENPMYPRAISFW